MGWLKRLIGAGEIVGGVLTGQPGLAVKGGADVAGSFGGGKAAATGSAAPSSAPSPRAVNLATPPPISYPTAGSIDEHRTQTRARMKRTYGYPGG